MPGGAPPPMPGGAPPHRRGGAPPPMPGGAPPPMPGGAPPHRRKAHAPPAPGGGFGAADLDHALAFYSANKQESNFRGASRSMPEANAHYDIVRTLSSSSKRQSRREAQPTLLSSIRAGKTLKKAERMERSKRAETRGKVSLQDQLAMTMGEQRRCMVMQAESLSDSEEWSDEEEVRGLAEVGAMAMPVASRESKRRQKLEFNWLLSQQGANGCFTFQPSDSRFTEYSAKNISSAVEAKLKDSNVLDKVLATLFALAAMKFLFATRKTEWQFMFAKGKSWVSKQLTNKSEFDGLIALLS